MADTDDTIEPKKEDDADRIKRLKDLVDKYKNAQQVEPHSLPAPEEQEEEPSETKAPITKEEIAKIGMLTPRVTEPVPLSPLMVPPPEPGADIAAAALQGTPMNGLPVPASSQAAPFSPDPNSIPKPDSDFVSSDILKMNPAPDDMNITSQKEIDRLSALLNKNKTDEEPEEKPEVPEVKPTIAPATNLGLSNLIPIKAPAVSGPDYIQQLLAAQKRSSDLAGMQMIGKGAERIGSALARTPHDKDYLNEMDTQIKAPVAEVMERQKLMDAALASQLQKRQVALAQDKDDPTSDISKSYRSVIQDNFDGIKGIDNLSATQMEQIFPPLKAFGEQQEARAARQELQETKMQGIAAKNQEKKDKDLDSANQRFVQQVTQVRGDKALNNQKDTVRRVDNALTVINSPMWKGNLNNIPQPMVNIISKDIDSIVSGGVSSESGFKEISNPTIMSRLARGYSNLGNTPTGAQLGAFIKQNESVLQDLKDKAQSAIKNKYDYIDKTLGPHIRPEDRENSKNAFYQEFLGKQPDSGIPATVTIKRKSDGVTKTLSSSDAAEYLKDPRFEMVK